MKSWVREASLNRLNMIFRSKSEASSYDSLFKGNEIDINELESSGLSLKEIGFLKKWITGSLSGRHCMIALLECRDMEKDKEETVAITSGVSSRPIEFSILSSSLSLPEHFLCDSGYLIEHVFSHPPGYVIREALKMLTLKALERPGESLRSDQINLALKQIKIDHLCSRSRTSSSDEKTEDDSVPCNENDANERNVDVSQGSVGARAFHLCILIELIRLHIKAMSRQSDHSSSSEQQNDVDNDEDGIPDIPMIKTSVLEQHLDTPLPVVAEEASQLPPEDLEVGNQFLKPYIKQLSTLKASLSSQLKDLEDSRAYISLGINKNASEGDIRKAYHSKAIKLHPDKPGGDTAKFQQLQANYQEIMSKRKSDGRLSGESPVTNPKTQEETRHAREVLRSMADCLDSVKQAADKCTKIGQLSIQWLKSVDRDASAGFPHSVEALHSLLTVGDEGKASKKKTKKTSKARAATLTVDSISPEAVAELLECVCDQMQKLSSLAMRLPSCGFRYGLATAIHGSFMKLVEQTMTGGLSAMKLMTALLCAADQIKSCRKKIIDSRLQAVHNQQIHTILVEMVVSTFRNCASVIGQAADACVDAAVSAAELYRAAGSVVDMGEKEAVEEAKRDADKKEKESDMCEEDRVFMAEKQKRDREEMGRQAEKQYEEQVKQEEEEGKRENEENVEILRVKIKNLQVQLRVQHIQALQSLNREARDIQVQIQQQLRESVLVSALSTAHDSEVQWKHKQKLEKAAGESMKGQPGAPPLRLSLLSLLADFLDSSCNALREEVEATAPMSFTEPIHLQVKVQEVLHKHVGWLSVFGVKYEAIIPPENSRSDDQNSPQTPRAASLNDIDDCPEEFEPESKPESESKSECKHVHEGDPIKLETVKGIRLALLPDYRSKALWLCCLVDDSTVNAIINNELKGRMSEALLRCWCGPTEGEVSALLVQNEVCTYCDAICDGIRCALTNLGAK